MKHFVPILRNDALRMCKR